MYACEGSDVEGVGGVFGLDGYGKAEFGKRKKIRGLAV
jgi:hypothetical protein